VAHVRLLAGVGSSASLTVGEAPSFLFSGNLLCAGPDLWIVGAYRDNFWDLRGKYFSRLEFLGAPLTLRSRQVSPDGSLAQLGSFEELAVMGNVLYSDRGVLARLSDAPFAWHLYTTRSSLRDLMIETADASG